MEHSIRPWEHFENTLRTLWLIFLYRRKVVRATNGNCDLDRCAANTKASMQSSDEFGILERDWDKGEAQTSMYVVLDMELYALLPGPTFRGEALTRPFSELD